ncbi:MAG: penicillin-binding protein 1A [bacterium]
MSKRKKGNLKKVGVILILTTSFSLGLFLGFIQILSYDLPDPSILENYQPSLPTNIYDRNNKLITSLYLERRIIVNFSEIPDNLIKATLSIEDKRYYKHWGIDPLRIVKALWIDLITLSRKQGASTLTQQLARDLFLTKERTIIRKIKEILLAIEIEKNYTKDEILEFYFNQIYYGHNAYGASAAAKVYFGKELKDLTLAECALLAGLPKAPGTFSPFRNLESATKRRNLVLEMMVKNKFITREVAETAKKEPIKLNPHPKEENPAPYFTEYVRRQLEAKFGSSAIYRGGLNVYTTLDIEMQKKANEVVTWGLKRAEELYPYKIPGIKENLKLSEIKLGQIRKARIDKITPSTCYLYFGGSVRGMMDISYEGWSFDFKPEDVLKEGEEVVVKVGFIDLDNNILHVTYEMPPYYQGAMVVLNPKDGSILAMVGGADFKESSFNRAYQAKRQPGSAFKVFLYTAAVDNGFTPADIVIDAPFEIDAPGLRWRPSNYSKKFSGPMTIRHALEQSINIVAAKTVDRIGIETLVEYSHKMGIKSELNPVYSLALGSSEVTLLEMCVGYATLANYGVKSEPYAIRYIEDRDGNIIEQHIPQQDVVLPEATCSVMIDMMKGVIERGTGVLAKRYGFNGVAASKTGTTEEGRDAWMVGFTPELLCGVWVGRDDHESIHYWASCYMIAAPMWGKFMASVVNENSDKFENRGNLVRVAVCEESGLISTTKCKKVRVETFIAGTEPTKHCDMHKEHDFFDIDSKKTYPSN